MKLRRFRHANLQIHITALNSEEMLILNHCSPFPENVNIVDGFEETRFTCFILPILELHMIRKIEIIND